MNHSCASLPDLDLAERFLEEAKESNPGPWVDHSRYVAEAARAIASAAPELDPHRAFICGLLHDIGRRVGPTSMRHILDGYVFLDGMGFVEAARICMTHSFPLQNTDAIFGEWDCSTEERRFVDRYISEISYTIYDQLFQLCDALALPSGIVLLEKRMLDVAIRHGTDALTAPKWRATFEIKELFEDRIGGSIYDLLPGVVENTFR